jgi:hypothetical protein
MVYMTLQQKLRHMNPDGDCTRMMPCCMETIHNMRSVDSHVCFWYALDHLILPLAQSHWNLYSPVQRAVNYTIGQLNAITHVDVYRHLCAILMERCPRDGSRNPPSISLG